MTILCVCTGNTCRSPIAAALLADRAARRGLPLTVYSAGLAACVGDPATDHAVAVLAERGIDLSAHRSAPLTRYACDAADKIAVMTASHRDALLAAGVAADKICVLDVPDPFGGDRAVYRACADRIAAAAETLLPPFSIVPLAAAHIDALAALEAMCFSEPWSREAFLQELQNDAALFLVAESPTGEVLGYVGCLIAASDASIANLAIAPSARRQKVATWLLAALAAQAADRGADALYLEVRASNTAARALYEAAGFIQSGTRPRFYRKPEEDAVLYTKPLREVAV